MSQQPEAQGYEVIEQDNNPTIPPSKLKINRREIKERNTIDTDKPSIITSRISDDLRVQLGKDSREILHGFHLNGRQIGDLHSRTKEILQDTTKTRLLLVKAPAITPDGTDLYLMHKMYIKWGESIFGFLGKPKPAGDFLVFIKDVTTNNIYMPCCHDVKPIQPNQLVNHFTTCLQSKVDGSKCAFCNSTDLVSNTFTTVNFKKEHVTQNVHINSIYLVLDYVKGGLRMVDVRLSDSYLLVRPFSNYFLKNDGAYYGYHGFIDFLKTHMPTEFIERTPIYSMLKMYRRKAENSNRDFFKIPCEECDCTFPTFTGFYLGVVLGLETTECACEEGRAYVLPTKKIDELYELSKQMALKGENNASRDVLIALFGQKASVSATGSTIDIEVDLDQLLSETRNDTNSTIISGNHTQQLDKKNKQQQLQQQQPQQQQQQLSSISGQMETTNPTADVIPSFNPTPRLITEDLSDEGRKTVLSALVRANSHESPSKKKKTLQSTTSASPSTGVKIGNKTVKTKFLNQRTQTWIIHSPNQLAAIVGLDPSDTAKFKILRETYYTFFHDCELYDQSAYQHLVNIIKDSIQ